MVACRFDSLQLFKSCVACVPWVPTRHRRPAGLTNVHIVTRLALTAHRLDSSRKYELFPRLISGQRVQHKEPTPGKRVIDISECYGYGVIGFLRTE